MNVTMRGSKIFLGVGVGWRSTLSLYPPPQKKFPFDLKFFRQGKKYLTTKSKILASQYVGVCMFVCGGGGVARITAFFSCCPCFPEGCVVQFLEVYYVNLHPCKFHEVVQTSPCIWARLKSQIERTANFPYM